MECCEGQDRVSAWAGIGKVAHVFYVAVAVAVVRSWSCLLNDVAWLLLATLHTAIQVVLVLDACCPGEAVVSCLCECLGWKVQ